MAGRKPRTGTSKRTYRFEDALIQRITAIAERERRTTTAQIELFLMEKVKEYEKKAEPTPGNRAPQSQAYAA